MNKPEAARYLGVSVRALERYTQQHKINVTYAKGKTKPTPVYDEEELKVFKAELEGKLARRPAVEREIPPNPSTGEISLARFGGTSGLDDARQWLSLVVRETVSATLEGQGSGGAPRGVPVFEKLTLSLIEASQLSGLSRNHLRQAIEDRKLKARIIGRGWRVKRDDLDTYVRKL
jgi:excisionase family DNA binding protein